MENTILIKANVPQLPQEIIAQIAGYCWPKEKNILMRVCKDFYSCLKDRALILKTNSSTVSLSDKEKDMFAYTYADNIEMMSFLLKNGAKSTWKNILGMTLFHIASDNKNTKAMQLLVDHGANISIVKPDIQPLHEAVYKGDQETVEILLQLKDSPNDALANSNTPLHIASAIGYTKITQLLLDAGADTKHTNKDGATSLHFASHKGHFKIVQLLINKKANINSSASNGTTPLMLASWFGNIKIVKLLLDNSANMHYTLHTDSTIDPMIKKGDTAFQLAQKKGHTHIVKLLEEYLKKENESKSCIIQ